mgnify:CR=1 FL=1
MQASYSWIVVSCWCVTFCCVYIWEYMIRLLVLCTCDSHTDYIEDYLFMEDWISYTLHIHMKSSAGLLPRPFKPRTLSGRQISRNHRITTPHWIASSSPGLCSTIASCMLFLQLSEHFHFSSTSMPRELNVAHTDFAGKICHQSSLHRVCRSFYHLFAWYTL